MLLHTEIIPGADYYSVTAASRLDFELIAAGLPHPSYEQIAGMPSYLVYTDDFAVQCRDSAPNPYAYDAGFNSNKERQCSKETTHVTHEWIASYRSLAISGTGRVTPFLIDSGYPVVNSILGESISNGNLVGVEVVSFNLNRSMCAGVSDVMLSFLAGKNPMPMIHRVLDSGADNRCPFCGRAPLYCEECGHLMTKCSNCGDTTIQGIAVGAGDDSESRRVNIETLFPEQIPENRLSYAVDLRRCNKRWDFSGTDICSRRMLKCLLDAGAYPLVVTPLLSVYDGNLVGHLKEEAIALADYRR